MIRLVIDLGSSSTKIYMLGCGVVLSEATCVAVSEEENEVIIKSFGDNARALSGKAAHNTRIVNPVYEGDIVRMSIMTELMKYFLTKIEVYPRKAKSTEVLFTVPCSADAAFREKYSVLAEECGIGRVYFTKTPFAAFLGHNVTLSGSGPVFCVDMGYGKTDIAAFSPDGIIAGYTVSLGGGNVDAHIIDLISEKFMVRIGGNTAEKLKNSVGSLLEDDNKTLAVGGRDINSGRPAQVAVNSYDLEEVITLYVDKICEYIRTVMSDLPAEVSSAVAKEGIYLSGGFSKLDGMREYMARKLDNPVNLSEEPSLASVIGGCTILSSPELCSRLVTEE